MTRSAITIPTITNGETFLVLSPIRPKGGRVGVKRSEKVKTLDGENTAESVKLCEKVKSFDAVKCLVKISDAVKADDSVKSSLWVNWLDAENNAEKENVIDLVK